MGVLILAIDPGTAATGYAVVEAVSGRVNVRDFGCINTSPKQALPQRLHKIHGELCRIIEEFRPEELVVEGVFFKMSAAAAIGLGQAKGVTLLAAANYELPAIEYSPLEVKKAVTGYGRAEKRQVQQMVKAILRLSVAPPNHAADALALAICHANSRRLRSLTV